MLTYRGKSVYRGIAIGKIRLYRKRPQTVKRTHVADCEKEVARFESAREAAAQQLRALFEKARGEVGSDHAAIFEIHQMMLSDEDYLESIVHMIRGQNVNAEYAVAVTCKNFSNVFSDMEDAYMQARAADVRDISERILQILTGSDEQTDTGDEPVILVAEDLVPSETVQLDKSKVLAFVTVKGSANSHTAILARTMNIPAVIRAGIPLDAAIDGKMAVVDGDRGNIYIDPDAALLEEMQRRKAHENEQRQLLLTLKGKKNVTRDGTEIKLYANIGNSKDLALVLQNDAGGIGLFRSEFIYLERQDFPTEEEQFQIYRSVAETMSGHWISARTNRRIISGWNRRKTRPWGCGLFGFA